MKRTMKTIQNSQDWKPIPKYKTKHILAKQNQSFEFIINSGEMRLAKTIEEQMNIVLMKALTIHKRGNNFAHKTIVHKPKTMKAHVILREYLKKNMDGKVEPKPVRRFRLCVRSDNNDREFMYEHRNRSTPSEDMMICVAGLNDCHNDELPCDCKIRSLHVKFKLEELEKHAFRQPIDVQIDNGIHSKRRCLRQNRFNRLDVNGFIDPQLFISDREQYKEKVEIETKLAEDARDHNNMGKYCVILI